jgi:branched-chain amino acid aminotransferase
VVADFFPGYLDESPTRSLSFPAASFSSSIFWSTRTVMHSAKLIWMNGKLIPWHEATVHVLTHALHYGSSVFEGIRSYDTPQGPAIFRLQPHMQRLFDSAKCYRMPVPYTPAELTDACCQVVAANGLKGAYIRPLIFRGQGTVSVIPKGESHIDVCIVAFELGEYLGTGALENGIDCCVSSWHRVTSSSNPVLAKAGGHYTNAYLIGAEARANGFDEGISINPNGMIAEAAAANLFLVRGGVLYTPPLAASVLGGITRDSVICLAQDLGLTVVQEQLPRELLYICDELFLTGTAAEITPVRSVDRIPVGSGRPGPVTRQLQKAFFDVARGLAPDQHGWLDFVTQPQAALQS